ncbi:hypothetical protein [Paraburkholderia ferrariae]|uniref:DUF4365 domain-containing protein n=1 Tax=Paraburkholderia ferrariae TaxID=386056 RepID=A0ABU9S152_9BURK
MNKNKAVDLEDSRDKTSRGNASQFYVAAELCRRGHSAVVTLGNTPNTDVLCSNREGTRFVHIQVKTFVPGTATCSVGVKAERTFGPNFFWVLAGIPAPSSSDSFRFFVIPSAVMSEHVARYHRGWLDAPGKNGQPHRDNTVRAVTIPPRTRTHHWSVEGYEDRWELIEDALSSKPDIVVTEHPLSSAAKAARRNIR